MEQKAALTEMNPVVSASVAPRHIRPLANRNFRLLWLGENVSHFGDQFYLIALPWLVFQMTGSSLAFGTLLMVEGVPRAVFTLVGGAVTDRISPRVVMIASNLLRLTITLMLILVIAGQVIQLWMLYVIAFCFGLVDAFFHPAYRAMIPLIVSDDHLKASNSLMLSASQLVGIIGPSAAGVVVQTVGGLLSFALDALTFLFTSVMLMLMRPVVLPQKKAIPEAAKQPGILTEIGAMLAFVRHDTTSRTLLLIVAAINLLFSGPLVVGMATLGKVRFAEGSAAFGAMLSAFSIGMLMGTLAAGAVHSRRSGLISLLLVASEGVFMIGVAYSTTLIVTCGLFVLIGFAAGFGNVNVITLSQKRVAKDMMGRFMSLIVLAEIGLVPISNALAGILADVSVTTLYVLACSLLALTGLLAAVHPTMRSLEYKEMR